MSRLFQLFAFALAVLLTPGAGELVENIVHVVADGHGAHAMDDAQHTPSGDEHGCTGMMHSCTCCGVPSVALNDAHVALESQTRSIPWVLPEPVGGAATGHGARLERPPAA